MNGVKKFYRQNHHFVGGMGIVYEIDLSKAEYKGYKVRDLGTFGRRKFENLLFAEGAPERLPMKFIYH